MRKKVIFLLDHFEKSNGVAKVLINLCNALDEEKYDITIAPLYRCDLELLKEFTKEVHIKNIFGFYFKGFSKILKIIPPKFLYKRIVKENFDIEVAFQCDMSTIIIANSSNKKAVHVAWMHGYQVYPKEYLNYDKVVCVAKDNSERCKREVSSNVDVTYCHSIQDEKQIYSMSNESAELPKGNGLLLTTVGRLSPEKGFSRLVKIMADLKKEGFDFRLMIIGGGSEEENIKRTISSLNLENNVFMLGKQDNPHKFTVKSDLFICSSYSESFHTASTEAAVLGVPILSTEVSGAGEIIEACGCGLVTKNDDESLKNGLRKVLSSESLLSEWRSIMKTSRKNFNFDSGANRINKLFDEFYCLSDKRRDL